MASHSSLTLFAIPGFLGDQTDWSFLELPSKVIDPCQCPCDSFQRWVSKFYENHEIISPSLLVGYSLGGRLALHLLKERPDAWTGAVFISSHPGLASPTQRSERVVQDKQWSDRFRLEPWEQVMVEWNTRATFVNDPSLIRYETLRWKETAPDILEGLSLGRQENFRNWLNVCPKPILWIVGGKDPNRENLSSLLPFSHQISKKVIVSEGGHRLLWTHPHEINQLIHEFSKEIGAL